MEQPPHTTEPHFRQWCWEGGEGRGGEGRERREGRGGKKGEGRGGGREGREGEGRGGREGEGRERRGGREEKLQYRLTMCQACASLLLLLFATKSQGRGLMNTEHLYQYEMELPLLTWSLVTLTPVLTGDM